MGYRVQSYSREELKKLSLPGGAVTALFWAIPVGKWKPDGVENWWRHFTESEGFFQELGLLLVRDYQADDAAGNAQTSGVIDALNQKHGARLTELLPAHRKRGEASEPDEPGLLVLAGSYPQPGWGVLVTVGAESSPKDFERLFADAARNCCGDDALTAIRNAANAYQERERIKVAKPVFIPPREPEDFATPVLESYAALEQTIASGTLSELDSRLTKLSNALKRFEESPPEDFWKTALRDIKCAKDVGERLAKDEVRCTELLAMAPGTAGEASRAELSPRDKFFLHRVDALHKKWPDLPRNALGKFLKDDAQVRLWAEWEPELQKYYDAANEFFAGVKNRLAVAKRSHDTKLRIWGEGVERIESEFRERLTDAFPALWETAPAFLMALERNCGKVGLKAESIAWDEPRMIGWKLHSSQPNLNRSHVLDAANGILPQDRVQRSLENAREEMDGSFFADYVYHVSINASGLGRWEATKMLIINLLGVSGMKPLVKGRTSPRGRKDAETTQSEFGQTPDEIAAHLLASWGWPRPSARTDIPLVSCMHRDDRGNTVFKHTTNEVRTSFEGFLKDIARMCIASLGWSREKLEAEMEIHCADYNKGLGFSSWKNELAKLTVGNASVILRKLLPLAFAGKISRTDTEKFNADMGALCKLLNKGSHHSEEPPPTIDEIKMACPKIQDVISLIEKIAGGLPWHLSTDQTFLHDPVVVTGRAWSHGHPEERVIKVLLWKGEEPSEGMLVWNRSGLNPVMTDAVVI